MNHQERCSVAKSHNKGAVMKKAIKKALKEAAIFLLKAIASAGIAEILHLIFG